MKIKIHDYILTPSVNATRVWDLSQKITRNKVDKKTRVETGETYEDEQMIGYGMRLEACIMQIIADNLNKKEETVSLKQYLNEYKKEKDEILKILESY